ncbi:DUF2293 domain-containing protein [Ochrobactrum sp. GPK 3]|uniref:DUF2293 domain-containing protein n=1 Tax=Brucella sp. 22210 TaxID=3453892 RepID=UPI003138516B
MFFSFRGRSAPYPKKHPGCPDFAVEHIARLISEREWEGVKLGRAVGITIDGILRHQMTEYETLLLHGVDRKEARRRVQPKVNAMLKVWAKRPEAKPPAPRCEPRKKQTP